MLKKNVFITFGGNLISTMFLVGASVVLARILGPADRGILGLALLVPIISATFCTFGQETVNNTFAGLYQNQRVCLFQQTLIVTLAGSVVSSVLILGFFFRLPFDKGQFALIDPEIVWLSLLVAPLLMLNTMILGLLRGIGRINTAAMVQVIGSASYLLLLFVLLFGYQMGIKAAMIITALTPSVSIIISLWVVREYISFRPRYFSKVIFQKSLRFGFQVGLATLAAFLVYRIDQGILGYLVSAEQVGIYIVAVGLADRVKMLPHAIATVFLPYLTNDIINRQQQVPQVFRYATIISVGSMVLIGILGAPAVWLFFGREYMNAIAPFLLLLPGIAALGAASVLANDLAAREKPKYSMWISITILVFNIVLNFIFIPWIGISGAALASTLCYLGAIGMWIVVYQHESHTAYRALVPRIDDVGKVFQEIILLIKPQRPI